MEQPSRNRWDPDWGSGCIPRGDDTIALGSHSTHFIRDAAFYALVQDDAAVARAVVDELVTQSGVRNADFSNSERFCLDGPCCSGCGCRPFGTHPYFTIAHQMQLFLVAFDYVKGFATAAEQETVRRWLRDAAQWMQPGMKARYDDLFVNRWEGDWTPTRGESDSGRIPFYGGPEFRGYSGHYNNRDVELVTYIGLVGIEQDVEHFRDEAKQWFEDYFVASVYPEGYIGEFNRWTSTLPDLGWAYGHQVVGSLALLADAFARTGDTSLYEFTTTEGVHGSEGAPPGWPGKSLRFVIHSLANLSDATTVRYGTDDPARQTIDYRIDGYNPADGSHWRSHQDIYWSIVNLYYRDPYIRGTYMRTNPGMRPYWSNPSDRDRHWMGRIFPGVLFVYGQLEDEVWPYPIPR